MVKILLLVMILELHLVLKLELKTSTLIIDLTLLGLYILHLAIHLIHQITTFISKLLIRFQPQYRIGMGIF